MKEQLFAIKGQLSCVYRYEKMLQIPTVDSWKPNGTFTRSTINRITQSAIGQFPLGCIAKQTDSLPTIQSS